MTLVPLMDVARTLAVRDRRTVLRRLAELGVPVVRLGGRLYVNAGAVEDAVRERLAPVRPARGGTVLASDARLWD